MLGNIEQIINEVVTLDVPVIEVPAFEEPITLCSGGCCPVAIFSEDNVTITDEGQTIVFTKDQAVCLAQQMYSHGFFTIIMS